MYRIKPYTYAQARALGVTVKPSRYKGKKIDVFSTSGKLLASVGATGYADYPTYLEKFGPAFARERQRLYKIRHEKDRKVKGSAGWYADKLLW